MLGISVRKTLEIQYITNSLSNFVELSPSWESASCASTQELPNISLSPKFQYQVHKSLHWSLSWATLSYVRSILILSTHLHFGLTSVLLYVALPPISYMHSFVPYSCYMSCHPILIDFIILILLGEEYQLWSSPLWYSLQPFVRKFIIWKKEVEGSKHIKESACNIELFVKSVRSDSIQEYKRNVRLLSKKMKRISQKQSKTGLTWYKHYWHIWDPL
jgi:hypothetical protein